ncbi:Amino acid/polyamine transporter I [Penicillium robsamsonii]|uniref:Amino acid/polyamine transporter I n=1 Tax=Penicillium robsamsonii TaxID=1792511 RepID=UPI00254787D4|nr:Amino acid/polyamine transporter I [Penicillium robsamsonii]KAJ5816199.1 Amino acid/polyamine transporter I [Penicillium robsamsonii]
MATKMAFDSPTDEDVALENMGYEHDFKQSFSLLALDVWWILAMSLLGLVAVGAVNNSLGSNYILGQVSLVFPDFVIERWHVVLVAWAVGLFSLAINVSRTAHSTSFVPLYLCVEHRLVYPRDHHTLRNWTTLPPNTVLLYR